MCQTWKHRQSTPFGPESRMPRHQIFAFCLSHRNCNNAVDQLLNILPLATSLIASPGDTFQASAADTCHLRRAECNFFCGQTLRQNSQLQLRSAIQLEALASSYLILPPSVPTIPPGLIHRRASILSLGHRLLVAAH